MLKPILSSLPSSKAEEALDIKAKFTKMKRHQKLAVLEELKEKMRQAALNLEFEEAAALRDQIKELVG
jgi:excinuclease UvrABC nuclease subunit